MSSRKRRSGKRPAQRPDYGRIARLERELGIGEAAKAVHPAIAARAGRGNRETMIPLADVINAMTQTVPRATPGVPLPRDPYDTVAFGPMHPMVPAPLDPPRQDTGRPEPRLSEFDVGWNLPGADYRLVPWKVLRDAARGVDVLRRCIEIRKRHITSLKWAWTVSEDAVEQALLGRHGTARVDVEAELREKLSPEIARLTAFWRRPWRANNKNFKQWASMVLEEHLVVDAVAIYPEMTYGGDCLNLEIISGSTIKPLRDWRGALPRPPYPAYQQILYGFPRGEFTATVQDTPEGQVAPGAFAADQMYYYVGTPFADTPYGLSAVEQALISARLYLKRQGWMLAEYDDGVTPNTWLIPPPDAAQVLGEPFTVLKRREWEDAINDELAGNTALRHRAKVTPPGFTPQQMATVAEQYKPDYDFFLIRLLASHMDVTLPELNITEPGGLGASGYHEGQEDVQNRIGTRPTAATLEDIVNDLSTQFLHAPPELTFTILDLESDDEAAQDQVAQNRVQTARMTINEDRDRQGQPRFPFPEADMPMLQTGRGIVFLEGASQLAPAGEEIGPPQAPPNVDEAVAQGPPAGAPRNADKNEEQAAEAEGPTAAQKNAEAAAYQRWLAKRDPRTVKRPFEFQHLSPLDAMARGLLAFEDVGVTAVFKAGDAGPKASPADWPGWRVDRSAADYWAPLIAAALLAAIDLGPLAQVWAQQPATGAQQPTQNAAIAWLTAQGVTPAVFAAALTPLLARLFADGWAIGTQGAQGIATGGEVDWAHWQHDTAEVQRAAQQMSGYRRLLLDAGVTITSIADTRIDELGQILADAITHDLDASQIEEKIRALLADPAKARVIAVTELCRAQSAAAAELYRAHGITSVAWMAEPDACPICLENAATDPRPLGQAFPSGDALPPAHPNCFPAGVLVTGPSVIAATARRYEGDLVAIVFADGQEVPVTPNHPVLTPDGWVAAGDLHEGVEVLRARDAERVAGVMCPDDRQAVSRIEDVAAALRKSLPVASASMPVAAEDFHGDGAGDDQVKVVYAARHAEFDAVPEFAQVIGEFHLLPAEWPTSLGSGDPDSLLDGVGALRRFVGVGKHGLSLPRGRALPADGHRHRSIAGVDAEPAEHSRDGGSVDTVAPGERLDGLAAEVVGSERRGRRSGALGPVLELTEDAQLPVEGRLADARGGCALAERLSGLVELDRVVELRRVSWRGHVFNLETVDGWYFANGIVSHNCRCWPMPAS